MKTFYQQEILKIRSLLYNNQGQIDTVIGVRHYLEENFSEDIRLEKLSGIQFVSTFHLLRLFKRYYGQTPHQYLTAKRIAMAKSFLKSGLNVSDTCFALGYETPSSFCTLFKNKTGLTPTAFSKRAISTKSFRR